ncbi:MAG: hypothetical protein PHW52_04920 [Candidatus Pacebacteria bacterium]|nr:hypothetical protein [Candidatus Paceibacterota bacterium]
MKYYVLVIILLLLIVSLYERFGPSKDPLGGIAFLATCILAGLAISKASIEWHPIQCLIPVILITYLSFLLWKTLYLQPSLFTCEVGSMSVFWGLGYYKLKAAKLG